MISGSMGMTRRDFIAQSFHVIIRQVLGPGGKSVLGPGGRKHLTGDRIRILLLNLPFVFRDLIAPEVKFP
jgi:hypothetical protein